MLLTLRGMFFSYFNDTRELNTVAEMPNARYPAARPAKAGGRYTSQGSILPFGKIGLDPLLQIILGADGRVLPLRPEDLDIFIGLAKNARL